MLNCNKTILVNDSYNVQLSATFVLTILYSDNFFLFWWNLKNVGLRAKNVLLSIVRSHFLTKMVFLQSSIIKIFYAHENSFFHHIFLSFYLANEIILWIGKATDHYLSEINNPIFSLISIKVIKSAWNLFLKSFMVVADIITKEWCSERSSWCTSTQSRQSSMRTCFSQ